MRKDSRINKFRVTDGFMRSDNSMGNNGLFRYIKGGNIYRILVSDGNGWDHVSIVIDNISRCPTWDEMCMIKDLCFDDDEVVVQIHPKKRDMVNNHQYCLHLWRNQKGMEAPDSILVGIKGLDNIVR